MSNNKKVLKCLEENGIVVMDDGVLENLTSLTFIAAVFSLEDEFEIEIPDEYLIKDMFANFDKVLSIVEELIVDNSK